MVTEREVRCARLSLAWEPADLAGHAADGPAEEDQHQTAALSPVGAGRLPRAGQLYQSLRGRLTTPYFSTLPTLLYFKMVP